MLDLTGRKSLVKSTFTVTSGAAKPYHFIPCKNLRASPSNARIFLRSAIAPLVNSPCLRAFPFPLGAPEPAAPPCMRQRVLPCTAGERQAPPERVLAPQRGLASIGPVFLT
jgi:hypothetical protein